MGLGTKAIFKDDELVPFRGQLTHLIPQTDLPYAVASDGLNINPRRTRLPAGRRGPERLGHHAGQARNRARARRPDRACQQAHHLRLKAKYRTPPGYIFIFTHTFGKSTGDTRRGFLKTAAAVAAGAGLVGAGIAVERYMEGEARGQTAADRSPQGIV